MNEPTDARQVYWVGFHCPTCGILVRASSVLRAWQQRPTVSFEGHALVTKSGGPGKLTNLRAPLLDHVRAMPYAQRQEVDRRLEAFFLAMERRLLSAAREARAMASRVRYL